MLSTKTAFLWTTLVRTVCFSTKTAFSWTILVWMLSFSTKTAFSWTTVQLKVCCVAENMYIYKLFYTEIMQTLKNDVLAVRVAEHGAELQSIKKGATEYLWQGDPAFWGRRSPVLFPIVGSVWEKRYRVDGVEYELGQHGFARDMEFELVAQTEAELRYRLQSTEGTLKKYPYQFILEIAYRLHGNSLDVVWEVTNPSNDKELHFQIGAHPAFIYPDYSVENKERGYLVFDRTEGLECIRIKEKGCVDAVKKYPLEIPADGRLPISSKII